MYEEQSVKDLPLKSIKFYPAWVVQLVRISLKFRHKYAIL